MRNLARIVVDGCNKATVVVRRSTCVSGSLRCGQRRSNEGTINSGVRVAVKRGIHGNMSRNSDLGRRKGSATGSSNLNISALRVKLNNANRLKVKGVPLPSKNAVIARWQAGWDSELLSLKIHQITVLPLANLEPFHLSLR